MLIKFNSEHDQEAKSSYKMVQVQVSRPLQIPESGEITPLFPLLKAEFTIPLPFTVGMNGLVTIVATQSLQLGAVFANTLLYFFTFRRSFSRNYRFCCPNSRCGCVCVFGFLPKMAVRSFLGNMTSSFEILKI